MMLIYLVIFGSLSSEIYRMAYPESFKELMDIGETKLNNIKTLLAPTMIGISYNSIYYYSCCQIYFNKIITYTNVIYKTTVEWLNYLGLTHKEVHPECIFEIYNNGNLQEKILLYNHIDTFDVKLPINEDILYDLILAYDNNDNIKSIDKIDNIEFPIKCPFSTSDIKFIAIELIYNNISYPIQLKTDTINYYTVGTILNKNFFKYYLINVLNIKLAENNLDYKIIIVDHNVNMVEVTPDQSIIIKDTNYEIK
jgi:hypothetical protein